MKTILYDSENNKIIGHYPNGYLVNGKPQVVDPPIYELPYTTTTPPEIIEGEYLVERYEVDMENKEYRQVWEVKVIPPVVESVDIADVMKILIKKTLEGVELTEAEILILKSYNDENNIL